MTEKLTIADVLQLSDADKQIFIQTHLPGLSSLNRDVSVLMTGYENIAENIILGNKDENYEVLINVIDRLCQEGKLNWHAVNTFHAANLVGLEKLFNLTVVSRDV